jgi:hypothetical protein
MKEIWRIVMTQREEEGRSLGEEFPEKCGNLPAVRIWEITTYRTNLHFYCSYL